MKTMFPDLDLSLVQSLLPSRAQLVDASESALDGMKWLGEIGFSHTKNIFIWSLQTIQASYEFDWNEITMEDLTDTCIRLLTYEVLTGLVDML